MGSDRGPVTGGQRTPRNGYGAAGGRARSREPPRSEPGSAADAARVKWLEQTIDLRRPRAGARPPVWGSRPRPSRVGKLACGRWDQARAASPVVRAMRAEAAHDVPLLSLSAWLSAEIGRCAGR
eukprot:gene27761-39097_t